MVTINSFKVKPNKKIIDDIPIQIVYIPLNNKLGLTYDECVKVGDKVCIGSILGKSKISDTKLLSSVSGTVVGFEEKYISNNTLSKCIVIENDFKEKYINKLGKKHDITKYSKDEFVYLLKEYGIIGMSGNGFPTYIKYDNQNDIKYLIVNGVECEAYVSSDSAVMYQNPEEILECIDAIIEIMHLDKVYIAINEKNEMVIKKLLRYINTYPNIKIYPIMDAYPSGYERYLVKEILDLKYDRLPLEVGAIVENVSTIKAIYDVLKYHKPLSERLVTITGDGVKNPANYLLKIGTNLNEVVLKTELYKKINNPILIAGGAMMGTSIKSDEFVITPDVNCLIINESKSEEVMPCIKCGKCSEVCPMNLIPSLIIEPNANIKDLKINKCINCGLCSYVCPSKIEVRDIIKEIKEKSHE